MFLFISTTEVIFIFFIVLLIFGADKIPVFARSFAKTITQVRQAANEIKHEVQNSVEDIEPTSKNIAGEVKKGLQQVKDEIEEIKGSIKREL